MEELKGLVFVRSLITDNTKANGQIIKSMTMEFTPFQTEDLIKGIIKTIKSVDMELTLGQTEESIQDNGKMIEGMAEELILSIDNYQNKVYGNRIRE